MEIAASITSGDLARLADTAAAASAGGADRIHLDVEDGVFIPTFTVGPRAVAAIRRVTRLPLEVHLQTVQPERWVALILEGRPDRVILHPEGTDDLVALLRAVSTAGAAAGLALLLRTPAEAVLPWVDRVDHLTFMATPPEGGDFDSAVLAKVALLRGKVADLSIDGGVTAGVMSSLVASGATVVVAGRAIFAQGLDHVAEGIAALRRGTR